MRLVWLDINASHAHASLALPLLHHACRDLDGIHWDVVRGTTAADIPALTAELDARAPDVVLATLYLFTRSTVLTLLSRLKALRPACRMLVGGPECLGPNEDLLRRNTCLTAAVRGEGEAVLPELLGALLRDEKLPDLPGVCRRLPDQRILDRPDTAIQTDWASSLPPSCSPFFAADKPFVQLETSRGCPRSCTFCCSGGDQPFRYKSPESVRRELLALAEKGIGEIRVLDRTFNLPLPRTLALIRMMIEEFPDLRFHLEIHPDLPSAELRRLFQHAPPGMFHLEVGWQTGNPRTLRRVKRYTDPDAARDALGFLTTCPTVEVHADLLAGLPEQTLADVYRDTMELVRHHPEEIQLEVVKALPGTAFRDQAADMGLTVAPDPPYDVLRTPWLTVEEFSRIRQLSRFLDRFYNHPALRDACRNLLLAEPATLPELLRQGREKDLLSAPVSLARRFVFLFDYAAKKFPAITDQLILAWMDAGLSPGALPSTCRPWKHPIPADVTWTRGTRNQAQHPDARIWHVLLSSAECWFVFVRSVSQSRPVARAIRPRPPGLDASPGLPGQHPNSAEKRNRGQSTPPAETVSASRGLTEQ